LIEAVGDNTVDVLAFCVLVVALKDDENEDEELL
jgi:hypothetical protein